MFFFVCVFKTVTLFCLLLFSFLCFDSCVLFILIVFLFKNKAYLFGFIPFNSFVLFIMASNEQYSIFVVVLKGKYALLINI